MFILLPNYILFCQILQVFLAQKTAYLRAVFKYCAGTAGLEPVTYCVTGSRSNQLSYAPIVTFGTRG